MATAIAVLAAPALAAQQLELGRRREDGLDLVHDHDGRGWASRSVSEPVPELVHHLCPDVYENWNYGLIDVCNMSDAAKRELIIRQMAHQKYHALSQTPCTRFRARPQSHHPGWWSGSG